MPDWLAEYTTLAAADQETGLVAEDLERLAVAAFVTGHGDEVVPLRERAHEEYLRRGMVEAAVRCAFWIGFHLNNRGDHAQASGWLARSRRLVADGSDPYLPALLTMPDAVTAMYGGDGAGALPTFEAVARHAREHGDVDAFVLAGLGEGRCLAQLGQKEEAWAALDEIMLHVVAGVTAPQVAGLAYCSVVALCMDWYDLGRAQEWTTALTDWLASQHGMVAYRGTCLVHRAELLQLKGAWDEAAQEARTACDRLTESGEFGLGQAHYRIAELARLRGDSALAEQGFERGTVRPGRRVSAGRRAYPMTAVGGAPSALCPELFGKCAGRFR